MLVLNNKKFAKNEKEFMDSLFKNDGLGSCVGYYKALKNVVNLMDHNRTKIGVITKNNVLAKANKQRDGKWFYNYADIPLLGKFESYSSQQDQVSDIVFNMLTRKPVDQFTGQS